MEIKFMASLPDIKTAVSFGSDGGMVKIEVPESEVAELLKLTAFGRGKPLEITIAVPDGSGE